MSTAAALFIAALCVFLAWPPIRFASEEIRIAVYPSHVEVAGFYHYENPFPVPVPMGFSVPFLVDAEHPEPIQVSAVRIEDDGTQRPISLLNLLGRTRFDLYFAPREKVTVRVDYAQYTPTRNATYIITTTQPWGRPLERAAYRVVPKGVSVIASNYALKPCEDGMLGFDREGFMPDMDWTFGWEVL